MKKIILSTVVSAILATSASAFMGLNAEIGGGLWQPALGGDFKYIQKEQIPEDKIWLDCSKCQYSHLTCGEVSLIKSNLIK